MDDKTGLDLIKCGVNIETTLGRFMNNEELFFKFLKKFLADENFSKLKLSIEKKEFEKAFNYSHTLKGVAVNLGLDNLSNSTSKLVEKLRVKDYVGYKPLLANILNDYNMAYDMIKSL